MPAIITYPDSRLMGKSDPVLQVTSAVRTQAMILAGFLRKNTAMGVSLPQFGILVRMIALRSRTASAPKVIINPEVRDSHGSITDEEGCLSLPGVWIRVTRAKTVAVTGIDLDGEEVFYEATGYAARAAIHEIDHLNGVLLWDHLPEKYRTVVVGAFSGEPSHMNAG